MSVLIKTTSDPEDIKLWAKEIHDTKLYLEDGLAKHALLDSTLIRSLAYWPGVGWAMFHQNYLKRSGTMLFGVFVAEEHRGNGFGRALTKALGQELNTQIPNGGDNQISSIKDSNDRG